MYVELFDNFFICVRSRQPKIIQPTLLMRVLIINFRSIFSPGATAFLTLPGNCVRRNFRQTRGYHKLFWAFFHFWYMLSSVIMKNFHLSQDKIRVYHGNIRLLPFRKEIFSRWENFTIFIFHGRFSVIYAVSRRLSVICKGSINFLGLLCVLQWLEILLSTPKQNCQKG